MVNELQVEGYTLKQVHSGSSAKELWNNSINLNNNISKMINN